MKNRCAYIYPDGAQCTIRAATGMPMCEDHRLLTQRAKDKALWARKNKDSLNEKRRERRKEARKNKPPKEEKDNVVVIFDHTAPWACRLSGCEICEGKPTYDEYMTKKFGPTS